MQIGCRFCPTGWLGALAGSHKGFQMHEESRIAEVTNYLAADLIETLKPEEEDEPQSTAATSSGVDSARLAAVAAWTPDDVANWLTRVHVAPHTVAHWRRLGMDGSALVGLVWLRRDRSLGDTLKHDLGVRNPVQRLHIVCAVEALAA